VKLTPFPTRRMSTGSGAQLTSRFNSLVRVAFPEHPVRPIPAQTLSPEPGSLTYKRHPDGAEETWPAIAAEAKPTGAAIRTARYKAIRRAGMEMVPQLSSD